MAVLIRNERSSRWLNLSVFLLLIAIIGVDLSAFFRPDTDSARQEARAAEAVDAWLAEQKEGGDGLRFWAQGESVEPLRFHSVRSWEVVHIEPFDHTLVRVDSLTEDGDPVSRVWKVYLGIGRGGERPITRVVDAADGSTPPPILARREESPLSQRIRQEREEGGKKLEALSRKVQALAAENERKVQELEAENARKVQALKAESERQVHAVEAENERELAGLRESLDEVKQELAGRMDRQVAWIQRMADQIHSTKQELAAAKDPDQDRPAAVRGAGPLRVFAQLRIAGPGIVVLDPPVQPRRAGPAPTPVEPDSESITRKAEQARRNGDYRGAADLYSDLIELYPDAPAAYLGRGECHASLHDFDRAIDDFATAIRLMPTDPRARLARSGAYLGKGATEQALSDAAAAIRLDPTLAEAHLMQAEAFARMGVPERADAARLEALNAFYRRGVASIIKHDYEPGMADLERVIRQAPGRADAHAWCGKAHYLRSDFANAIKEFTAVIALRPADKQSYNERGMAYFRTRDYDAAVADFDRAIGLDPKFGAAYMNRAAVRLVAGDVERAASDLSTVIELDPHNARAYRLRGMAYDRMGWASKAASDLNIAQSLGP